MWFLSTIDLGVWRSWQRTCFGSLEALSGVGDKAQSCRQQPTARHPGTVEWVRWRTTDRSWPWVVRWR